MFLVLYASYKSSSVSSSFKLFGTISLCMLVLLKRSLDPYSDWSFGGETSLGIAESEEDEDRDRFEELLALEFREDFDDESLDELCDLDDFISYLGEPWLPTPSDDFREESDLATFISSSP